MRHCFTYGTLMHADVMRAVCGRRFERVPATLAGHARRRVRNAPYPGLLPAPGSAVSGVLYLDVDRVALARLDVFEGEQYERREVSVATRDGRVLSAEVWLFAPAFHHLLEPAEWDFDAFVRNDLARFASHYLDRPSS